MMTVRKYRRPTLIVTVCGAMGLAMASAAGPALAANTIDVTGVGPANIGVDYSCDASAGVTAIKAMVGDPQADSPSASATPALPIEIAMISWNQCKSTGTSPAWTIEPCRRSLRDSVAGMSIPASVSRKICRAIALRSFICFRALARGAGISRSRLLQRRRSRPRDFDVLLFASRADADCADHLSVHEQRKPAANRCVLSGIADGEAYR